MARLVICDDESRITDILARFFREKGHEVSGTTRGEEALDLVLAGGVDLLVTDIAMQGFSGLDLLKRVKAAGVMTPVIITTGNPSHSSAVQALREGAYDYVVKPFHLEEILERADRALMDKRIREENVLYSKLVSLHSISKSLSEAGTPEALAEKAVQLGVRLTRSAAGWYAPSAPAVPAGDPALRARIAAIFRNTLETGEAQVAGSESPEAGAPESWFLSAPVALGAASLGVLIFRRPGAEGRYDAVDLEVLGQLGSTFALGLRALGAPEARPVDTATGRTSEPGPSAPARLSGTASVPPPPADRISAESWARLVGRLIDAHCLGYESKGGRVPELGRAMMRELGWPGEAAGDWDILAHVYDLHKLRVPQRILEKRKALTDRERDLIHGQGPWARDCLSRLPGLARVAEAVEDFHERFDGLGRPRGKRGEAIDSLARLLSVADAYVALRSQRPYREAYPETQAQDLIRAESGKRFDPRIVQALAQAIVRIR
jgi:response regulator RpfG family c-di-GMP phosphodiesterase